MENNAASTKICGSDEKNEEERAMQPAHRFDTCCFIGHRDINPGDENKINARLRYLVDPLLQKNVKYYGVGGAIGFDMLAAEYILHLRDDVKKKIKLISVLPCPDYYTRWSEELIEKQKAIIRRSDKVVYASGHFSDDVYRIRNEHLLAFSGYCIAYCHRTSGGTANTVRKAMEEGLLVYNSSSWDIRQLRRRMNLSAT